MNNKYLNYALLFLMGALIWQTFLAPKPQVNLGDDPIIFETTKDSFKQGKVVELKVINNTQNHISLKLNNCPQEPFQVQKITGSNTEVITTSPDISCENITNPNKENVFIKANSHTIVRYNYWSNQLFTETGRYQFFANIKLEDEIYSIKSNQFQINKPGLIWNTWNQLIYRPIYNALIFIIDILPGKSLGLSIILITLLIRTALYGQNKKALTAQKKMAEIQPKLNKIKEKYKDNQQKLTEETMKLWQTHKVNPMSGCLPLLIQFPILIALFFAIQDGMNPDQSIFLYNYLSDFSFQEVSTTFLNILDLTRRNIIVLPLIVGGLQFIQLYLTNNKNKVKSDQTNDQMQAVQNTMLYVMPAMIAVITSSLPAGVGLYWGTSTLYGIIQQIIINKENN